VHSVDDVPAAIARLTFDYARGIDDRDWTTFRSVFADACEVDFQSWSGAPPSVMASDVWVQAVRSVTGAFDATQHLMTNHRIVDDHDHDHDDDAAAIGVTGVVIGVNEVQVQHWFDADSMASFDRPAEPACCTLGGFFTNRYVRTDAGWRIAACRFTLRWRTGDETLFVLARHRR
jgi:SnoaL-like domain